MKKRIVQIVCGVLLLTGSGFFTLHSYLLDRLDGWFFSSGDTPFKDDTIYTAGYSDQAFRSVKKGMTYQDVLNLLQHPFYETWSYKVNEPLWIYFVNDTVEEVSTLNRHSQKTFTNVQKGMIKEDVLRVLGSPSEESWIYSKTPNDGSYRMRVVIFKNGQVTEKIHQFYLD